MRIVSNRVKVSIALYKSISNFWDNIKFDYLMKQFEASKSLTVGKYADNMEKDLEDFRATYVK
jgi:hypothetical protein